MQQKVCDFDLPIEKHTDMSYNKKGKRIIHYNTLGRYVIDKCKIFKRRLKFYKKFLSNI